MKKHNIISSIGIATLSFLSLTAFSPYGHAQESDTDPVCPDNPTDLNSVNGYCVLTPDKYEVKIYEMGLCTANPLTSSGFDRSSCFQSLSNTTPFPADMAVGKSLILKSQNKVDPPKPGEYKHAFIIISPEFKLNFTYKVNGVNYYSNGVDSSVASPTDNATTTPPAKDFTETLNNFGDYEEGYSPTATAKVAGGSITAILTDSNLNRSTSAAATTRLVGIFTPDKAITIGKGTKGLEVQFIVKDQAGGLQSCADDGPPEFGEGDQGDFGEGDQQNFGQGTPEGMDQVCRFGSGPFSAKFKPF